jgi:hypothetical protein
MWHVWWGYEKYMQCFHGENCRDNLWDLDVNGWMILKWILNRMERRGRARDWDKGRVLMNCRVP